MRTLLWTALLAGCAPEGSSPRSTGASPGWSPAEAGPRPPPPTLTLASTPWVPGSAARVTVGGAPPGSTVNLLLATDPVGPGLCPPQLAPDCLDLTAPVRKIAEATADPGGTARITVNVPDPAPQPAVRIQAVVLVPDAALSPARDVLLATVPPVASCPPPVSLVDTSQPDVVVGNGTPGSCTEAALRSAVAGGGVVVFDCGPAVHTLTVTSPVALDQDTVLDGEGRIILSGGGTSRILEIDTWFDQVTPVVTVQRLDLWEGFTTDVPDTSATDTGGAAIYRHGGTLTVIDSRFLANVGPATGQDVAGGAISSIGVGPTVIVGSFFEGNRASNGGALGNLHNDLTIVNSVIVGNAATGTDGNPGHGGNGGGLSMDGVGNTLALCGVTVQDNVANAFGGGVFRVANAGAPATSVVRSTFQGNRITNDTAQSLGGGAYLQGDEITLRATTFARNSSRGAGGLFVGPGTTVDFENATFAENVARGTLGGGLTLGSDTTGVLSHLTFARNRTPDPYSFAAAIAGGSAGVTLRNSVLADHEAGNIWVALTCNRTLADGARNVQWPDVMESGLPDNPCAAGVRWSDPGLGALDDHGGPNLTVLPRIGGPADGFATGCPPTDQRGDPRAEPCTAGAVEL